MDLGYFFTSIYVPRFEFSFPKIDFSGINFSFNSYFRMPTYNKSVFDYMPITTFTPVLHPLFNIPSHSKNDEEKIDTTKANKNASPETVKKEKINVSDISHSTSADFKPKTKKEKISSKKTVTAEEIKPGYYIKRFDGVDIQGLKPRMKEILIKMNEKAKELGYDLVLSSAYRSHQKQKDLKRDMPTIAASPYKSAHEYGVAIDICLYKNGKKVSVKDVPEFAQYSQSLGLTWGENWTKHKKEPWHFNLNGWQDLAEVRDEYRRLNNLA